MLIFSTKLYVKNKLTDEKFIELAINWVSGGRNYTFGKIAWDGSEEYTVENPTKSQKFTIMKYENVVIVHLVNKDGKVIWTNDFILTQKNDKRILAVLLYSDAVDMSVKLPKEFNRPILLKWIIRENYGDEDNGLLINDCPLTINGNNLDVARKLILGEAEYLMPIVYVTPSLYTSTLKIDCEELAKDLAGVAHVIVEESSEYTKRLRELTDGKNPYDGAVQIYYSANISQRIIPNVSKNIHEFRKEVAYSVFRRLILSRIDDEFSWAKMRYSNLMAKSKESIEIAQICDQLLDEKQKKIEASNQRIQELEDRIYQLQSKLQSYEQRFSKTDSQGGMISIGIQETDLYEDEIKDIILRTLNKELHSMDADPNLKESRKYHVLHSISQQNVQTETPEKIVELLKEILNGDGSFNNSKKKQLSELGFEVEEGKHYKVTYRGDDRYMFTLAKTPSDFRANKNAVSRASNKLFGY